MKDHAEIGHLTLYDAFRLNRDQVMDPEICLKSIQTSLILRQRLKFFMISVILFKMEKT